MTNFANALFTRMSNAKSEIKFRYVRAGLEIVGDQMQEGVHVFFVVAAKLLTETMLKDVQMVQSHDALLHLKSQPFKRLDQKCLQKNDCKNHDDR